MENEVLFLAEDVASYEGDNQFIRTLNNKKSVYYLLEENLNNNDGVNPLLSLVRLAKELKFDAINLEHRFFRGTAVPLAQMQLSGALPGIDENLYKAGLMHKHWQKNHLRLCNDLQKMVISEKKE